MKTSSKDKIAQAAKSQLPTVTISNNGDNVIIGCYLFVSYETVEYNYNRYSKGWHRKFGGVREVSDRNIKVYAYNSRKKIKLEVIKTIPFNTWASNTMLQAIEKSELFQPPVTKIPLSIRLNKWHDAKLIKAIGNVKIFDRSLIGEHVDYVAVLNGVTYHDKTIKLAVKGLHNKVKAATKKKNAPITFKLCRELGFCVDGIKAFCNTFNLDMKAGYSPAEIEALVKADLGKAYPFKNELLTLAKALNFKTSIEA